MYIDFEKREEEFEIYFQKNRFKEFEKFIGISENKFRDVYRQYQEYVQNYFNNFTPEDGVLEPLVAEVSSYVVLDFYTTLHSDRNRVKYPAVQVFEGEYFPTPVREKIRFLSCDEVMRRLMLLYWMNREFFDEDKAETQPDIEFTEGRDIVSDLITHFEKIGAAVVHADQK